MSGMKGRFPRYLDYARATLDGTLSREERRSAYEREAVQLASVYLENQGGGRFRLRPLPRAAQISPIYGILPGDFDGDGQLDALIVGNSYAPDSQTGRYDASIGGVLLGDGRGGFRFSNGAATGFFVDGDAKALAEARVGGGRTVYLATRNDDSLRVLSTAAPRKGTLVEVAPEDRYALLTLADGRVRRQELYWGSGYLSQSARALRLPQAVRRAVVYGGRGTGREIKP
jgi:hypothetical protein